MNADPVARLLEAIDTYHRRMGELPRFAYLHPGAYAELLASPRFRELVRVVCGSPSHRLAIWGVEVLEDDRAPSTWTTLSDRRLPGPYISPLEAVWRQAREYFDLLPPDHRDPGQPWGRSLRRLLLAIKQLHDRDQADRPVSFAAPEFVDL